MAPSINSQRFDPSEVEIIGPVDEESPRRTGQAVGSIFLGMVSILSTQKDAASNLGRLTPSVAPTTAVTAPSITTTSPPPTPELDEVQIAAAGTPAVPVEAAPDEVAAMVAAAEVEPPGDPPVRVFGIPSSAGARSSFEALAAASVGR